MRWTRRFVAAVLAVAAVAGLTACGGSGDSSGPATSVEVSLQEWSITPPEIPVPAGTRVELTIHNKGTMPHNLEIPGLDEKVQSTMLTAGDSQTVSFTPKKKGTYEVLCAVAGHKDSGMVAKLIVE